MNRFRNIKNRWVLTSGLLALVCLLGFIMPVAESDDNLQPAEPAKTYPIYGYSRIEPYDGVPKTKKKGVRCWEVEIVDDNLPLSEDIMEALQWKEDDLIEWQVTEDGFLSFKRVDK